MSSHRRKSGLNTSPENQQTYVADMTGDGLADLVHIAATGKITYFPNHGYGAFGGPVEMGNPPVIESFDSERVRFIDVDGSGPTDLVYILPTGGVHIYFNQAGNSWTAPLQVSRLPRIVEPSSVFLLDLLGQGTACLCWHDSVGNGPVTTEIKYIDLMGGSKPHLCSPTKTAWVQSQAWFMLRPPASTSRIAYPCVSQLNTQDCITGNGSTTEYEYHNDCYDSVEKTVAGFEIDVTWVRGSVPQGDEGVYHAPASYTRSWFHVGLSLRPDEMAFCTPSCVVSAIKNPSKTPTLTLEAPVALRGSQLRGETYGLGGSATEHLPYTVQEFSYDVEQLQHHVPGKTLHAVFQLIPQSSLSADYGRALEDGGVTQQVVLAMTSWGDIARSPAIVYPRALKYMSGIEYEDVKASQRAGHVFMAEYSYTNAVVEETTHDSRVFRRPVAWQNQVYDTFGFPFVGSIMSVDELRSLDVDKCSKTLLSEERAFFRDSQLNDIPTPGKIEAFSVTAGQQQCGLTLYTAPDLTVGKMLREGGFVQLEGDKNWWQPSSRVFFTNSDMEKQELTRARLTFYQLVVTVAEFGHRSTLTLDKYNRMAE
ncbi:uncharacterized protein Aud_005355 [Aspergillus udagawae]|uniref:Insecticide toxin TcdB middle/C-terminal domain-containing protein n=1 Tax=Aspergillus udagawae TaxID=91492 RepID=A0A8E0QQQ7_9EURO|nr:uncharacterized protein Aud_005355 [Aspergillus udagawae]GIC88953.1 hypothetical protein Aud_005355 [Aspergillus udagawae]